MSSFLSAKDNRLLLKSKEPKLFIVAEQVRAEKSTRYEGAIRIRLPVNEIQIPNANRFVNQHFFPNN